MANINVKDLNSNIAGSDLFSDSESFMRDLSDDELNTQGGGTPYIAFRITLWLLRIM